MTDPGVLGQSWQQLHDFLQSLYGTQAAPPVTPDWASQPYGGHSTNYGPPKPAGAGNDGGFNKPYQAAAAPISPMAMPSRPVTPPPMVIPPFDVSPSSGMPARPATGMATPNAPLPPSLANAPMPPPRPKGKAQPDLGMNPRFTQVQYDVPGSSGGPLSRNPIYSALNLGA